MPTTETNRPIDKLSYGGIQAAIWKNAGTDGKPDRYSATYIRRYKAADGQWKDTSSFNEIDSLKLQHLIGKVIDRIAELKTAERQAQADEEINQPVDF